MPKKPKLPFQTRGTNITQPEPIDLETQAQKLQRAALEREGIAVPPPRLDLGLSNIPEEPTPKPKVLQPQVRRDQDTGNISGITTPEGKTFLAGNKREARELVETFAKQTPQPTPAGMVEAAQTSQIIQNQQAAQQAIGGLGQLPTQLNPALTDFGDRTATDIMLNAQGLLGAGAGTLTGALGASTLAGALGSIGAGSAAGAVGGPVGVAVGAAIGTASFVLGRITLARRNVVKRAYNSFSESKKSSTLLLNQANSGIVPPNELVDAYNRNLAVIYAARAELNEQVKTKVGKSLSGAQEELADIEAYLQDEGSRQATFKAALLRPNPAVVYPTEFDATPQD